MAVETMDFDDYVSQRGGALLRLAYVLTGDGSRAEDLTQTVLTDAFRHWRKVCAASNRDAYVRRMLVNAHLDWHRRRSSLERPTDLTGHHGAVAADPADGVASRDELRRLLLTLPPRARTALVLRYFEDLDDARIADAMGISPGAVRSTVSRALATLRADRTTTAMEETP